MFVFLAEKHNKWFLGMWLNDKVPLYGGNFDEMSKKSKRQKKNYTEIWSDYNCMYTYKLLDIVSTK